MGQCKFKNAKLSDLKEEGKGGFGKVYKVEKRNNNQKYAMKEMSKVKIYEKSSIPSIKNERVLLSVIKHPFIINMHFAFQTKDYLYIALDYLSGGDLRYNLCKYKKFNEDQTRFILSCLILALEYLHYNNVIHRDIKPENMVFDNKGYVYLTDMGIAKLYNPDKELIDSSGTPGYMAPEVITNQNHMFGCDYYAIGVILYELMMGKRPYLGKSRNEIKDQMFSREISIKKNDIPQNWSIEAADLAMKLLKRKPKDRLGYISGIIDIKSHSWFRSVNWNDLYRKEAKPPFVPKSGDNFDTNYCNRVDEFNRNTYDFLLNKVNNEKHFIDFYYHYDEYIKVKELMFKYENKEYKIMNIHEDIYNNSSKDLNNKDVKKINSDNSDSQTCTDTPYSNNETFDYNNVKYNENNINNYKFNNKIDNNKNYSPNEKLNMTRTQVE